MLGLAQEASRVLCVRLGASQVPLGIDSVLVEGGPTLHGALADEGLVNRVQAYVAPKLFGGNGAPGPVAGRGAALPSDGLHLSPPAVTVLGADLLLESEVDPCSPAS